MEKMKLRQFKSASGMPDRQRRTLTALGFKRMNQVIEVEKTPQILGMYNKLKHLVVIEK
jgi:large subunit ribosomal protein L30